MGFIREIRRDIEQEALCLMREYRSLLFAEAKQLTNDDSVAEDLVMKTIESYLAQPDEGLPAKGKVRAWLRTTLRNHFNNSVRGKARACTVYLDEEDAARIDEIAPADNSSDEAILAHSDAELVRNVLARLPQSARSVIVMHYFESLTIRQIAELLRKSPDSVKSNLYYARKVLAKRLGKMMGRAALAIAALIFGGSLLYAAAVFTGFAPSPFAADEESEVVFNAKSTENTEDSLTGLTGFTGLSEAGAPPQTPNHESSASAEATAGMRTTNPELTTTNLTTNNEETTMNTQVVKSAAVKALAAGAMLAAAAPTLAARSARADSINNYAVLQYLESSGTQAIDTGVKFGGNTRMSFRMQVLNGATGGQIGAIDKLGTDGKYDRFHFNVNNGLMRVWCDRQDEGCPSASSEGGTWHDYDINLVDNKVYRDGTQDISAANNPGYVGTKNNHSTIWIFGRNGSTPSLKQYATVRLGNVEIWQDGQLDSPTRRLFPCMRLSDNVLGMYDTVNNEFLTNVGTGTFKAGPGAINYDEIPPQIFNDEPVCPEVVVKAGVQRLVKDTDYTLAWTNNTATGLGKVTVTPIGSYADCAAFAIQFWIVPPEKKLPSEYQRIVYLESTPDGNQQLDTLVHPNGNMRVEVRFQSPDPNKMGMIGMIDNPPVERFHLGRSTDNGGIFGGLGSQYTSGGLSYSTLVGINWATMAAWTCLENDVPCGWFAVNGANAQKVTDIGTFSANNSTFGLFGRLSNSNDLKSYVAYRVMYMDVKEGDEQVQTHRFVPCRRIADGELGVYDTVARQFLYDTGRDARGAAAFWAGPDVGYGWRPGTVIYLH